MRTVLCFDDRTYRLGAARKLLAANGYVVLCAESSQDLLDQLAENPVDAVLLDCHTLGKPGRDPVELIRIIEPNLPIIMTSGFCSAPCTHLRDADACIQKGDLSTALLHTVETVLCARRYGLCRSVAC
jgi:CheY-like chemotaxis protein